MNLYQPIAKKKVNLLICMFDLVTIVYLVLDIPDLIGGLREHMKNYVILERKVNDLGNTKRQVIQELSKQGISEEPISHEVISEVYNLNYILNSLLMFPIFS